MNPTVFRARQEQSLNSRPEASGELCLYTLDQQGRVSSWSRTAEQRTGFRADGCLGTPFAELFASPETPDAAARVLADAAASGTVQAEGWHSWQQGEPYPVWVQVQAVYAAAGELQGFTVVAHDLSGDAAQEQTLQQVLLELQHERKRFHTTLESLPNGVITTDATGAVLSMNAAAEVLTGWRRGDAFSLPVEQVCHLMQPVSGETVPNPVREALRTGQPYNLTESVALRSGNGDIRDVQDTAAPIHTEQGELIGAVLVLQDITSLRTVQREIAFSERHDALTLLPNRREFGHCLEEALQGAASNGSRHNACVCFLDLDRFKVINDTAGHAAGDALLRSVANLLKQCVRSSDNVARLGGDEFGLILRGCNLEQAQSTLQYILHGIVTLPFTWEGRSYSISVSIGVTEVTAECSAETVMKQADVACYAAKQAGRNRISIYHPEHGEGYTRHLQMEIASDIRTAIKEDRFSLYAQTIVNLEGEHVPHYEVLLRMLAPGGGLISPAHFIPAAERYDLMADVDRWVLTRIFRHYGESLSRVPNLQLSVNLSANSLNDDHFLSFFLDLIKGSPLSPAVLTIEITETSLINNLNAATLVIDTLRAYGCKVALDDFGMGLCSFGYLRSFKVDCVKIDGSFVRNVVNSSVDLAIVKSINSIAHEIGARTVAEFVEDDSILRVVRDLRVDAAQGYGLGRPEPIEMLFSATCSKHLHAVVPQGNAGSQVRPVALLCVPA